MAMPNIFRKPQPVSNSPALDALTDTLARIHGYGAERVKIGQRIGKINEDVLRVDNVGAQILGIQQQIDVALADAAYARLPEPDLTSQRKQLSALERDLALATEAARIGKSILPKLQADLNLYTEKADALRPEMRRQLWEACLERMALAAPELEAAIALFKAAHRRAFVAARAADKLAESFQYGTFVAGALYGELNITKPEHPAFHANRKGPEAAQDEYRADLVAVDREADELINLLLSGDGE